MLRAFIAMTPPTTLQHTVAEVREAFQSLNLPWRWVTPEQIHLTLKFLGNVPAEQVETLKYESEFAIAQMRKLGFGKPARILAAQAVYAAARTIQAANDIHERRLSRAAGAAYGDKLAGQNRERHPPQRSHRRTAGVVYLGHGVELDDAHSKRSEE